MGMMGVGLENGLGKMAMGNPSFGISKSAAPPAPPSQKSALKNFNAASPLGSPTMTAVAGTATRALDPMTFMATGNGGMMQMHPEIGKYMRMFRRVPSWKLGTMGDSGW